VRRDVLVRRFKSLRASQSHFVRNFFVFVPSLSSCLKKATVALYFGRIRTRLGVVHFRVFRLFLFDFLLPNLLLVRSHQAEVIVVKRLIQRRNNVSDEGGS